MMAKLMGARSKQEWRIRSYPETIGMISYAQTTGMVLLAAAVILMNDSKPTGLV